MMRLWRIDPPGPDREIQEFICEVYAAVPRWHVGTPLATFALMDNPHCSIVDGPSIEDNAVVLRMIVRDPEVAGSGPVFVCKLKSFTDITVEEFPEGQTPSAESDLRAHAATAAKKYIEENLGALENLFGEIERRRAAGDFA